MDCAYYGMLKGSSPDQGEIEIVALAELHLSEGTLVSQSVSQAIGQQRIPLNNSLFVFLIVATYLKHFWPSWRHFWT